MHSDSQLDAQGLMCPEPLMLVRNRVREMKPGEVLYITATDPSTHRDLVNYCRFIGHELLQAQTSHAPLEYWIRKKA